MRARKWFLGPLVLAALALVGWLIAERPFEFSGDGNASQARSEFADRSQVPYLAKEMKPQQVEDLLGGNPVSIDVGDFGKAADSLLSYDLSRDERIELAFEKVTFGFGLRGTKAEYRLREWQVVPIPRTAEEIAARGTQRPVVTLPENFRRPAK